MAVASVWQAAAHALGAPPPAGLVRAAVGPVLTGAAFRSPTPALQPGLPRLVWEGEDIDGDGSPDFANPTGRSPRAHDTYGSGAYGASRDGGAREHAGVDYAAMPGETVRAPMSGFVSRIGHAYGDDLSLRYVEITNPALKHIARVLYVEPDVTVGQPVRLGAPIGAAASLQGRYPGITDHVHLKITAARGQLDPAEVIVARLERADTAG